MDIRNQIKKVTKLLDDKKGENIITLDLKQVTSFTDYFIIATANSETHLQTLAKEIMKFLKHEDNIIPINSLNETDKSWILIDYHDFVVHLFLTETREYYNLEELWYEAERI